MSPILKNNTVNRWKIFSVKIKRLYDIIFNTRNIEDVRTDFFSHKWISKEELVRLIEHEEAEFVKSYTALNDNYIDLLKSFNMNALSNYTLLERKYQGTLNK